MSNILKSYVPKFIIDVNRNNEDVIFVSSSYFSPEGDVYTVEKAAISPSVIQTTQSLNELQPEVSNVYPFKIVTPIEPDGSTLVLSPSPTTVPTASQHYYAPVYFERYKQSVVQLVDTEFTELTITAQ
jgi:hypothetical protein